jgi:hypothetical protein
LYPRAAEVLNFNFLKQKAKWFQFCSLSHFKNCKAFAKNEVYGKRRIIGYESNAHINRVIKAIMSKKLDTETRVSTRNNGNLILHLCAAASLTHAHRVDD